MFFYVYFCYLLNTLLISFSSCQNRFKGELLYRAEVGDYLECYIVFIDLVIYVYG